jgi:RNA polymerase sigma-70 factor (ECF subfamily)
LSPESFETIYNEEVDRLWSVLRSMGVPESDVEDLAHAVFLVVLRKIDKFEGRSKLSTWIYSIALKVTSQHRRTVRRRRQAVDKFQNHRSVFDGSEALHGARSSETIMLLDKLPFRERAALVLCDVHGFTTSEAAECLKMSPSTLHKYRKRAQLHMSSLLAENSHKGRSSTGGFDSRAATEGKVP